MAYYVHLPTWCDFTEVLSILATEKVKSVKRSHTIIEFVAVWSV